MEHHQPANHMNDCKNFVLKSDKNTYFLAIFSSSPCPKGNGKIPNLDDLGMISRVFYYCVTPLVQLWTTV